jgi:hypothetical protein
MRERVAQLHDVEYRMALPDCWARLPMETNAMRSAARAYLLRKYGRFSRDETVMLRRQLEEQLVELTRRPGAEYARMLLALSLDIAGRPVSASCLVSVVDQDLSDHERLIRLLDTERHDALDSAIVQLAANRCVVVIRDGVTRSPTPDDPERVAAEARRIAHELGVLDDVDDPVAVQESQRYELDSRAVDVWVPVPDDRQTLLLQFSTTVRPLFDQLTELFLLTAGTVQFRRPDGSWE